MLASKYICSLTPTQIHHDLTISPCMFDVKQSSAPYKFRTTSHNKRTLDSLPPQARFSHQEMNNSTRFVSKIKRRISTAGASKRFPKDFFRNCENENVQKKQPALMLKWRRNLTESQNTQKTKIDPKKKEYRINIDIQMSQNNNLNTPKFNEPQNQLQDFQNQFMQNRIARPVMPFPLISQLNIETTQQIRKTTRPNFIKKVKKGQYLRYKIESNRSISQNNQFRMCSMQTIK